MSIHQIQPTRKAKQKRFTVTAQYRHFWNCPSMCFFSDKFLRHKKLSYRKIIIKCFSFSSSFLFKNRLQLYIAIVCYHKNGTDLLRRDVEVYNSSMTVRNVQDPSPTGTLSNCFFKPLWGASSIRIEGHETWESKQYLTNSAFVKHQTLFKGPPTSLS